jgi:long-chain acyl-CoA synthetase
VDPEELAVLLYTGGASGRPRAVMLSHRALLANVEQAAAVEPAIVAAEDVVLGVLPMSHVYGLNAVLGLALRRGAAVVLVEEFDAERSLATIEAERVTVLPVAPRILAHWRSVGALRRRLGGVRLVLSGAAPLAVELAEWFTAETGLPVHRGYGLTEAAPVVSTTLASRSLKAGSVGSALPGVAIRLVDDTGAEVPGGEDPAEILIAGDNLFSGYWPDGDGAPDIGGWWRTGDVGMLDADGDLFLVDRRADLIVVSGFNVYPSEVEDVIAELDGVAEAAVVGVPDGETGERVDAYVRQAAGSALSDDELVARVREHCSQRLARFKQPSTVLVVAQLPHTPAGRVAKARLRAERRRSLGLLE